MKLKNLQLLRFGPFTDFVLDLDKGNGNFHLVYGLNEAGKSTTRRAILGLLFGIAETTSDDHVHKKPDLRIGAEIENASEKTLEIVRRKGRKATLLDTDNNPISEDVLIDALGGVNKPLFETGFSLSHESLLQGARDLLSGKGELGESLFGAGLGVREIHALRTELKENAKQIFSPSASKRPLNASIKQFNEAKKKVTQESLKPRGWHELNEQLEEADARLKTLTSEQARVQAELTRLDRVKRILPVVKLREELLHRKSELGDVKLLDPASLEERKAAQQVIATSTTSEKKRLDEQTEIEAFIKSLEVPEKVLAREEAIEALSEPLGVYKNSSIERDELKVKANDTFQEMRRLLRDLKRDESPEEVNKLRIGMPAENRIRTFIKSYARIDTALQKAKDDVRQAKARVDESQRILSSLPKTRDPAELKQAIATALPWGDLDEQMHALKTEVDNLEQKTAEQCLSLKLQQGKSGNKEPRAADGQRDDSGDETSRDATPEAIAALPVPLMETVTRFQKAFHDLEKRTEKVELKKKEIRKELERVTQALDALEARGEVPSSSDLAQQREARDEQWQHIRAAWLDGASLPATSPEEAADDYESKVQSADKTADLLWIDADRSARHAALLKDRERLERNTEEHAEQLAQHRDEEKALESDWHAIWSEAALDPLSPDEMLEWMEQQRKLADMLEEREKRKRDLDILSTRSGRFRKRCRTLFETMGEPEPAADETHTPLLQRAEDLLQRIELQEQKRNQTASALENAEAALKDVEQTSTLCAEEMEQWRSDWGDAVRCIGLDAMATVEEAEALLEALSSLFAKADRYEHDQQRLEQIRAKAERFSESVNALVSECAPHLEKFAIEEAASNLITELRNGRDAQKDRSNNEDRLRTIKRELNELKRDRESAQETIDRLMKSAGCDTLDGLEEAEEKSAQYRSIENRLASTEEQLLAEGVDIDRLVEQADAVDPDTIGSTIEKTKEENESLKRSLADQNEACGRLKEQLQSMDGTSRAAEAAAEAEEALATMQDHARAYGALKLASLLLEKEIDRFRQENQDPLLKQAGEFFRIMTLEAFSGVATGFNASDEPILLCVREGGDQVAIEGLSDGTRDQLYLSLRLAGIDLHLTRNDPIPIVIDDVLINFDDARAEAALKVLGKLSEKTQVLFFTHHERLREIAEQALAKDRLVVHTLS